MILVVYLTFNLMYLFGLYLHILIGDIFKHKSL